MLCSSNKTKHKFSKVIIFPKKCPKSYICTSFGDLQKNNLSNLKIFLRIFVKNKFQTQFEFEFQIYKHNLLKNRWNT